MPKQQTIDQLGIAARRLREAVSRLPGGSLVYVDTRLDANALSRYLWDRGCHSAVQHRVRP